MIRPEMIIEKIRDEINYHQRMRAKLLLFTAEEMLDDIEEVYN